MYNLVDIHCHSNMSYDAFENNPNGLKFNIKNIFKNSKIKMICLTDHNIFDYRKFLYNKVQLKKIKKKLLPGMELTIDGIHWIIIMDDKKLREDEIGVRFSKLLLSKVGLDYENYNINELRNVNYNALDVIQSLDELKISYIAIPHWDKDKGIFRKGNISEDKIQIFLSYIRDNIVYGFETKYHDKFFETKIKKINELIKVMEENNSKDIDKVINQLKNIESTKKLSSAFIYGSDFHGKKSNDDYLKCEKDLFYIKSECSFQGLRLALIDYDSRVYSCSRLEQFKKETNKVLEYIRLKINNNEKRIYFGDSLNSIIGSRGTGKSYLLRSIINQNSNYEKSDIYIDIKILGVKLRGEKEKSFIDSDLDIDFISQKNSGLDNSNNIYDLLSEAPYDTKKFVNRVRKMSTTNNKNNNIEKYFNLVNECIMQYISLENLKKKPFDYQFTTKYNKFYSNTGETFKIISLFERYITFCDQHISSNVLQNKKLNEFNQEILKFCEFLEYTKNIKDYGFTDYNELGNYIKKLKELNDNKITKNNKNISRIKLTKDLVVKFKESIEQDVSNEDKFYNNSFKELSVRIKDVINSMIKSKKCYEKIIEFGNDLSDTENIEINKNNLSISLTIEKNLKLKIKKFL